MDLCATLARAQDLASDALQRAVPSPDQCQGHMKSNLNASAINRFCIQVVEKSGSLHETGSSKHSRGLCSNPSLPHPRLENPLAQTDVLWSDLDELVFVDVFDEGVF